jgi:large subunit ribosomal protein L18
MGKKLKGTSDRPRLYIFRSNKHIYAQVIDDVKSKTLFAVSSMSADIRMSEASSGTCNTSRLVGKSIAEKCLRKGITKVVFDRGQRLYHGRVQTLAESAREAGMHF